MRRAVFLTDFPGVLRESGYKIDPGSAITLLNETDHQADATADLENEMPGGADSNAYQASRARCTACTFLLGGRHSVTIDFWTRRRYQVQQHGKIRRLDEVVIDTCVHGATDMLVVPVAAQRDQH